MSLRTMRGGGCDDRDAGPSGPAGPGCCGNQARRAGRPWTGRPGKGATQPDGRGVGGLGRGRLRVPAPIDLHTAERSAGAGVLPRRARTPADGGSAATRGGLRGAAGGAAGHGPHHPAADVGPPSRDCHRTAAAPARRRPCRLVAPSPGRGALLARTDSAAPDPAATIAAITASLALIGSTTRTVAMTTTDIQRAMIVASPPSSPARLHLASVRAGQAVLDGGWWPRSWDPVAELPGLI